MKKRIYVLMTWKKKKQAELAGFVINIVTMMTNNMYFVTPAVKMDDMTAAATRYTTAYGKRKNGSNAKAEFKQAKEDLFDMLATQAEYVTATAENNDTIIMSSGFDSSKSSSSKSVIPAQAKVHSVFYKNGELILTADKVKGANSYCWVIFFGAIFDITISGNVLDINQQARYMMIPAGTSRETVRGIGVGVDLNIQVLAQNAAGRSPFSASVFVHTGTN